MAAAARADVLPPAGGESDWAVLSLEGVASLERPLGGRIERDETSVSARGGAVDRLARLSSGWIRHPLRPRCLARLISRGVGLISIGFCHSLPVGQIDD